MISIRGIEIPNELVIKYYKKLLNKSYKILPIFEGAEQHSRKIVEDPFTAYESFQKYIDTLIVEIVGNNQLFIVDVTSIELLSLIRGIREIDIEDHSLVRLSVFKCTDLCKKIIEKLESEVEKEVRCSI